MKKSKKHKINLISKILYYILFFISVILIGLVFKLNILPLKYSILLIIVAALLLLVIGKISIGKKFKSWVKIFADFISLMLIVLFLIILFYLNSTLNFMRNISASDYQTETYYVLVNKESKYNEIESLKNKLFAIYKDKTDNYEQALSQLKDKININETIYDNYFEIGNGLLNSEVDAVLLSSSYKEILADLIVNFESNVKIIYTIDIKSKNNVEVNKKDVTKESFNIYISGVDVYGDVTTLSRSDVNMVVTVNPKTNNVLLTSIPRDYYVKLYGTNSKDKLTHAGMYGIETSINTVENLLELDIDYYIKVNFTSVINLVDAIGGINVYSDTAFTSAIDKSCRYFVGTNNLDGKCALAYSRERYAYIDGDRHRVRNQQDVISAIMNKTLSSKTLITKYNDILKSVGNSFETNIPSENIYDLINMQLNLMPSWNVTAYSLNGFDSTNITYTFGSQQLYVMEPDMNTVQEAINKIDAIMKK